MINIRKTAILGAIFSSALVLSACNLYKTQSSGNGGTVTQTQEQQQTQTAAGTVTFSDSGVSPSTVTIKSGESLTWVNNSSKSVQVGSANHPTHTLNRELTSGEFVTELAPGASATVTLTKKGTWGYHNHLDPSVTGKVVVE